MGMSRFERLLRQHEHLRRARDHAFVWCGVAVLLFIPAFASLVRELSRESEPNIVGQIILIVIALPAIYWTFRSGRHHQRALKALSPKR